MFKIAIINSTTAYLYMPDGSIKLLTHSHGNVRHLVLQMLGVSKPVAHEQVGQAHFHSMEGTSTVIEADLEATQVIEADKVAG